MHYDHQFDEHVQHYSWFAAPLLSEDARRSVIANIRTYAAEQRALGRVIHCDLWHLQRLFDPNDHLPYGAG